MERNYSTPLWQAVLSFVISFLFLASILGCESESDRRQIVLEDVISEQELEQSKVSEKSDIFYFGFDLRSSPQEDAQQYLPLLKYLEKVTGLHLQLRFTPKDNSIITDLGTGIIHFAAIGAGSYLLAHEQYGVISLVRGLNHEGKAEYQSCLVTSPQSTIAKVDELKGKFIAFGSRSSTQGYLIPRITLAEEGIDLQDFVGYTFTGSHRNCAEEVISGRADACGMQDTMAKDLFRDGLVKILYTSKYYPSSGIAVNKDVPQKIRGKIQKALLDFQPTGRDAANLYNWDKTEMPKGFIEAKDSDYDELRYWAKKIRYLPSRDQ